MSDSSQIEPPSGLHDEILRFVKTLRHPVLLEDSALLFDLADSDWRLEVKFGRALLEVWGQGRSIVRRIEAAEQEGNRLRLLARRPGTQWEAGDLRARYSRLAGARTRPF
jgi:hypothetical protein